MSSVTYVKTHIFVSRHVSLLRCSETRPNRCPTGARPVPDRCPTGARPVPDRCPTGARPVPEPDKESRAIPYMRCEPAKLLILQEFFAPTNCQLVSC
jgi:hypothetical protein